MKKNRIRNFCSAWLMFATIGLPFACLGSMPTFVLAQDEVADASKSQTSDQDASGQQQKAAAEIPSEVKEAQAAVETKVVPWIYRAYKVKVFLLLDGSARWTPAVVQSMKQKLLQQLEDREPSAWRPEVEVMTEAVHPEWRKNVLSIDDFSEDLYNQCQDDGTDKVFLVRISDHHAFHEVSINELDAMGWSLGPVYNAEVADPASLEFIVADTIAEAFRPVARIENTLAKTVLMSVRAHGLMFRVYQTDEGFETRPDKTSPCWIEDKEVFEPVKRKINRQRKFELSKIEHPEYTLLVQDTKVEDGPSFEARVISSKTPEAALGRRSGKQTERYGIVVRTPPKSTTVQLVTMRGPSIRELSEYSLNGYEVFSLSAYGTSDSTEFLGKTDWQGKITIPPTTGDERVRLLMVINGERRLARLPVMPGYQNEIKVTLPDDDTRINAEGVVSGLRSEVLDLVARREVFLERMTLSLLKGASGLDAVLSYYEMYDELKKLSEWEDLLATTQRSLVSADKREQNKIDAMFKELQDFAKDQIRPIDDSEIAEMVLVAKQGDWEKVRQLVMARQERKKKEAAAEKAAAGEANLEEE